MGKIKIHKKANNLDLINNMFICLCACDADAVAAQFTASFYNEFYKEFNKFAELSKDAKNYKYYVNIDKALELNYSEEDFLNELEDDVDITFLYDDDFDVELASVMKETDNRTTFDHAKRYWYCTSKEVAYHAFDDGLEMLVVAEH